MNRHYSKEDYIQLTERLYVAIPNVALTTDIIVGYPNETEEDFLDTLDVVRRAKFASAFTFMYSKRSGTPAAERTEQVPRKVVSERFDRLTAELYPLMTERNTAKIGCIFDVITECKSDDGKYRGRTDDNTLVHFSAGDGLVPGEIVPVRIVGAKTFYVSGEAGGCL